MCDSGGKIGGYLVGWITNGFEDGRRFFSTWLCIYLSSFTTSIDLLILTLGSYGVFLVVDWFDSHQACIDFQWNLVECLDDTNGRVELVKV